MSIRVIPRSIFQSIEAANAAAIEQGWTPRFPGKRTNLMFGREDGRALKIEMTLGNQRTGMSAGNAIWFYKLTEIGQ
jgi:hypothetical protein